MKKFILGILVGTILFVPSVTFAVREYYGDGYTNMNVLAQFNCHDGYVEGTKCNQVAVFDDQDNKCYVSYDNRGTQSSISCVRGSQHD